MAQARVATAVSLEDLMTAKTTNCEPAPMLGENNWDEFSIEVPWGTVQGKWWGCRNKQPILALHGWQDNCGTFDRLCPLLPAEYSVLAIDLPGHGNSSHYPQGMQYFIFWDGICLIRRIVRKYNWKNVILLGHSLGGALTFMYAASFPNEVSKLINIDIAGPTVRGVQRMAEGTGKALDKFLDYETLPVSKQPCYSYDEMVKLVLDAYDGSVDEQSVKILMKRGMKPNHEGYLFARDLRLKVSLLGLFTSEQTLAYARQIRCKVLNIRGVPGMKFEQADFYAEVIDTLKQHAQSVVYVEVPGTHHLHLVTPDRVAPHISQFLLNK
ncbi:probable serine hydrolase isoform X1 [Drosophila sulfurigaster albostrigata]|uniref:Probable serine hydrolase n=2 Tax=nasuta subgroup TaxID=32307 RepID=A0A6P8WDC5_DROAB|nr:probable serine hydrolase [Drosophila albomicans]XP_060658223.1 probable serine hydrolase [Drosophila nasuta]XP_062143077.1 probable serine hydrolase isoform X1 [Drosophila sulfurigaster albostrigata]